MVHATNFRRTCQQGIGSDRSVAIEPHPVLIYIAAFLCAESWSAASAFVPQLTEMTQRNPFAQAAARATRRSPHFAQNATTGTRKGPRGKPRLPCEASRIPGASPHATTPQHIHIHIAILGFLFAHCTFEKDDVKAPLRILTTFSFIESSMHLPHSDFGGPGPPSAIPSPGSAARVTDVFRPVAGTHRARPGMPGPCGLVRGRYRSRGPRRPPSLFPWPSRKHSRALSM